MQTIDWIIVVVYMLIILAVGVALERRAGRNVEDFFVAGRALPWWLLGTSMVATAFASDTPLFITKLVREYGLSGAWYYWNASVNGIVGAFLIAHLWRRTRGVTDAEFRELRYSGRAGRSVRVLWALYWSSLSTFFVSAWVLLAMVKLGKTVLGLPPAITVAGFTFDPSLLVVAGGALVALIYTTMSGMWGDVVTDFIQFIVAFFGTTLLAILSVQKVGGIDVLKARIAEMPAIGSEGLTILPSWGTDMMFVFLIGLTIQWWCSAWSDGGMYIAQRCMSARSEKQAQMGRYLGNLSQMAIIVWPWALTALCSLVLFPVEQYPELKQDPELAYPRMVLAVMPAGLRGLMVIAFVSAFMSAMNTVLNSNATYLVNDLYRRHLVPNATPLHYVWIGRAWMVVVLCIGGFMSTQADSVLGLSQLLVQFTGGVGGIFLLRWFWWRINAWSEISAYVASALAGLALNVGATREAFRRVVALAAPDSAMPALDRFFNVTLVGPEGWAWKLALITGFTMAVSLAVTWLTPPTEREHLHAFCRRVRPFGPGWKKVREEMGGEGWPPGTVRPDWRQLLAGTVFFYATWSSIGLLSLGDWGLGALAVGLALVAGWHLLGTWRKMPDHAD